MLSSVQPWSPDGKRIASGSNDKTVQVWDASNGRHLVTYTGHTDSVNECRLVSRWQEHRLRLQ